MSRLSRTLPWMGVGLAGLLLSTYAVASAYPPFAGQWLSRDLFVDDTETAGYYATIGAPQQFANWLFTYGFLSASDTSAIYYNAGDLGFGREMHCREQPGVFVACYVANHGLGPAGPPAASVADAVNAANNLGQVAMVYTFGAATNPVKFYIYGPDGTLTNGVPLDSQGEKNAPNMCLACHGGSYSSATNQVSGANFLPFDLDSFKYSPQFGYWLADQQEAFRRLNQMVLHTNPTPLIQELITKWYEDTGGINNAGAVFNGSKIAAAYNTNAGDQALYNQVVKPYCRTCHIAQTFYLNDPAQFSSLFSTIWNDVYGDYSMPHAELTSRNFWNSSAPIDLANNEGWALRVTKTADGNDGFCNADCSLREAVNYANTHGGSYVITFDVDGTFVLSLGELLITQKVVILGNGARWTLLDGNGTNRVFHLQGTSANVLLQGVTVQNGFTTVQGGGILNEGGKLFLHASVVRNNISTKTGFWAGAGIANVNTGGTPTLEVSNSTLGPGNNVTGGADGGGLLNLGGILTVTNSTLSGNTAGQGGGLFTQGASSRATVTHSTLTLNHATDTGGGLVAYDHLLLRNSLVAGNTSAGFGYRNCAVAAGASASLQGRNLLGLTGNCPNNPADIIWSGPIEQLLNTGLTPQANGVTSHALVPGSVAIDALGAQAGGPCALPAFDQRNLARPLDGNGDGAAACDIGAHEFVSLTVTSTADVFADDGVCTLPEAVYYNNVGAVASLNLGECPPHVDWIELSGQATYDLTGSPLFVWAGLTINGNGATIRRAGGTGRIFEVANGGNLSLLNVTLRDGHQTGIGDSGSGGALYVRPGGHANVLNSAFLNNAAASWGGGIANQGTLNLANSTLSGNRADVDSGGLDNTGTATLVNVTITNNRADDNEDGAGEGGGLGAFGGMATIKGSLVAGNFDGGGTLHPDVYNSGSLLAATSSGDPTAEGALGPGSELERQRLSAASPSAVSAIYIVSGNYNLIGHVAGNAGIFSGPDDQVGAGGSPLNPGLGGLTGSPPYHPLAGGSPAIDRIAAPACTFISSALGNPLFSLNAPILSDQRGLTRPMNGGGTLACDVGAVEYQPQVFIPVLRR